MERFLNKTVIIGICLCGIDGSESAYKGILTSYDDEYSFLDDNLYIVRKFIMTIKII